MAIAAQPAFKQEEKGVIHPSHRKNVRGAYQISGDHDRREVGPRLFPRPALPNIYISAIRFSAGTSQDNRSKAAARVDHAVREFLVTGAILLVLSALIGGAVLATMILIQMPIW
jgi:hypothetical protein